MLRTVNPKANPTAKKKNFFQVIGLKDRNRKIIEPIISPKKTLYIFSGWEISSFGRGTI
tara:strand:+ start:1212 stop:1388 length:177 start_codon:yes stop_codon:yes gene_type:complete